MIEFCCRCNQKFPVAQEPTGWRIGELRRLEKVPLKVRRRLLHCSGDYLCGACYTGLTLRDSRYPKGHSLY